MLFIPFGSCDAPKPGCVGAITRPPLASASSTGAAGSMPMLGCRNRMGLAVAALDRLDLHAGDHKRRMRVGGP